MDMWTTATLCQVVSCATVAHIPTLDTDALRLPNSLFNFSSQEYQQPGGIDGEAMKAKRNGCFAFFLVNRVFLPLA